MAIPSIHSPRRWQSTTAPTTMKLGSLIDRDPAPNEIISREVMGEKPPHILITNYSMLEYMMLRSKDDAVFSGAKLKFIVLDEAHIYKVATDFLVDADSGRGSASPIAFNIF